LELGVLEQLLHARLCLLMIARPVGDRNHVAHALLDLVHFAFSSFDLRWSIGVVADYPRPIIGPEGDAIIPHLSRRGRRGGRRDNLIT
jgi:hypothetical protein